MTIQSRVLAQFIDFEEAGAYGSATFSKINDVTRLFFYSRMVSFRLKRRRIAKFWPAPDLEFQKTTQSHGGEKISQPKINV